MKKFEFSKFKGFRIWIIKIWRFFMCETRALPWSLHFGAGISQAPSCGQNSNTTHQLTDEGQLLGEKGP